MLQFANYSQQRGRLLGLASLVVGWMLVFALVYVGILSARDGVMETMYLCGGAVAGAALRNLYPQRADVQNQDLPVRAPESDSKRR